MSRHSGSRLFTLRVWCEEIEPGRVEWRGQLHAVSSDESSYFRELDGLAACLAALISGPSPPTIQPQQSSSEENKDQRPVANDDSLSGSGD